MREEIGGDAELCLVCKFCDCFEIVTYGCVTILSSARAYWRYHCYFVSCVHQKPLFAFAGFLIYIYVVQIDRDSTAPQYLLFDSRVVLLQDVRQLSKGQRAREEVMLLPGIRGGRRKV